MPKRIVLAPVGSRGDVQPYIILGIALAKRGHDVVLAVEARLVPLVKEFGLQSAVLEGDSTGILFEPATQAALRDGSFLRLMSLTKEWEKKFDKKKILASYEAAIKGADVVVGAGLSLTQTLCVAQAQTAAGHPTAWIPMILGPTYTTAEYPLWALAGVTCGCRCLNRWTYNVAFKALWDAEKGDINEWRVKSLHLKPLPVKGKGSVDILDTVRPPTIIAGSEILCGPLGRVPGDYPSFVHVEGFLFAPEVEEKDIDPRVVAFLGNNSSSSVRAPEAAGASTTSASLPVIYLGFGSMPAPNPAALLSLAAEVCKLANCKAVLVAGWSAIESDPACASIIAASKDTLLVVKSVPHGYLFPRVSAIVHHCGVGTTASALKAGVPQVPCPFMLDQPHNAKLLVKLGVAPTIVPFTAKLRAATVASAVRLILNEKSDGPLHKAAKAMAVRVGKESQGNEERMCLLIEGAKPITV